MQTLFEHEKSPRIGGACKKDIEKPFISIWTEFWGGHLSAEVCCRVRLGGIPQYYYREAAGIRVRFWTARTRVDEFQIDTRPIPPLPGGGAPLTISLLCIYNG